LERDICFSKIKEPEIIILSESDSVGDEDVFRGLFNNFYTAKLYAKDSKALRFLGLLLQDESKRVANMRMLV